MSLCYSFSGKRVLVTGGGRGIGLGICKLFYQDGAILHIVDKDQHLLDKVKKIFPKAITICQDLLDWNGTRKVLQGLETLDHLVNNAGILLHGEIMDTTETDFDRVFAGNVKALVNCSAAFVSTIKLAQAANSSKISRERTIVNISSVLDRMTFRHFGIYGASKAAVTSLTKSMALEFAPHLVRVNCICPGIVNTNMVRTLAPEAVTKLGDGYQIRPILFDPIEEIDIAQSVLFLSSPLASKISATSLLVDGGLASNLII